MSAGEIGEVQAWLQRLLLAALNTTGKRGARGEGHYCSSLLNFWALVLETTQKRLYKNSKSKGKKLRLLELKDFSIKGRKGYKRMGWSCHQRRGKQWQTSEPEQPKIEEEAGEELFQLDIKFGRKSCSLLGDKELGTGKLGSISSSWAHRTSRARLEQPSPPCLCSSPAAHCKSWHRALLGATQGTENRLRNSPFFFLNFLPPQYLLFWIQVQWEEQ